MVLIPKADREALSRPMRLALEAWGPGEILSEVDCMSRGIHGGTLKALVRRGLVAPCPGRGARMWRRRARGM